MKGASMATDSRQQLSVLGMSTFAFTVCFAVWVIFSIIGIPIKASLGLSETQFGLLVAIPILTGSLSRLPLGMMTDKFGGRIVFLGVLVGSILPIWFLASATKYWHFLALGLCLGLAGGSFSVGISYTARWFSKERQGFAMGIFGAGNAGAAVTKFVAPSLVVAWGWQSVPRVYAVAMLVTAIAFWFLTFSDPRHIVPKTVSLRDQLLALKDIKVWEYSQYYSIVFGGYVALSLWMTKYYVSEYGFDLRTAALIAAIFVLPSGVIRAFGGWLSDRFGAHTVTSWVMWISWVCLGLLAIPPTRLTFHTVAGERSLNIGLNAWVFTALLFVVGIAWGIGKASVFKYIADDYPGNIGVISGIVGLIGGLGGFILPIKFGYLVDVLGVRSSAFMLMWGITTVSVSWLYLTNSKLKTDAELHEIDQVRQQIRMEVSHAMHPLNQSLGSAAAVSVAQH